MYENVITKYTVFTYENVIRKYIVFMYENVKTKSIVNNVNKKAAQKGATLPRFDNALTRGFCFRPLTVGFSRCLSS